jgi:hypothetical protein
LLSFAPQYPDDTESRDVCERCLHEDSGTMKASLPNQRRRYTLL